MGYNESEANKETNTSVGDPRLRVNKTTSMTLSTTPQTVNFNGTSPYNTNTFTVLPGQSTPSVWYDPSTQLFNFTSNNDKNYNLYLTTSIVANQLLSTLNLTSASLRMRLYIPSPTPVTFPGPDVGGYIDLGAVNLTGQRNDYQPVAVFANSLIRQYGFQVQLYLSNAVLGTVTLNGADVNLFPV